MKANCSNQWIELLHDWAGYLFILALFFIFALEEKWRRD